MSIIKNTAISCVTLLLLSSNALATPVNNNALYQVGTFAAALNGAVNGDVSYEEISQQGDFGLGTFNGITGELVAYDGAFYLISEQGKTVPVDPHWQTPYVQVIHFNPTTHTQVLAADNYTHLQNTLSTFRLKQNIAYAIHLSGTFAHLTLRGRSPRHAGEKAQKEPVYTRENVKGELVGYYFPEHLLSLTAPGYHLHFLSKDKKSSGHVMDVTFSEPIILELQPIYTINFTLPDSPAYATPAVPAPTLETYSKAQS